MPQAANITVKKSDGTTDVTYTSVTPSAGEGVPAIWQNQNVGTAQDHYPEFRLLAKDAARGRQRMNRCTFVYPQIATNSTTGITSVVNRAYASTNWEMPKGMTKADVKEFAYQYANLLASTLIKQCVEAGASAN